MRIHCKREFAGVALAANDKHRVPTNLVGAAPAANSVL